MKNISKILIITLVIGSLISCNSKDSRNYEYMPNMYKSLSYESYTENNLFEDNLSARIPVEGTIPRGYSLYEYEDPMKDMKRQKLI